MKTYTGAKLHGVNKQNVAPGKLGNTVSLDLGMIPEDVLKDKVLPLIENLNTVLSDYKIYVWATVGYIEDKNTDNEV